MVMAKKTITTTVLPAATAALLKKMQSKRWIASFYLAGGTALALQYGHRQSVDLDWFTNRQITASQLLVNLTALGNFELTNEDVNTVEGVLDGVKVSFMTYPYTLVCPLVPWGGFVKIAAPLDIALMKLGAIAGRNTKKDFIDLFVFLHQSQTTLQQLLGYLKKKFTKVQYDFYHLYKALIFFDEANNDPNPMLVQPVVWSEVKNFFVKEVKKITR